MQGVRRRGAIDHSLERIAALVGVGDRLAGIGHGLRQPAQRHLQLAEVAGSDRRVLPVLLLNPHLQAGSHAVRALRSGGRGHGGERRPRSAAKLCRLRRRFGETRLHGSSKNAATAARSAPIAPSLLRAVKAIGPRAAQDAVDVYLLARLLLSPGEAAVDDGLVERLQAVERIGPVRRRLAQVIEQPRVGLLERVRLRLAAVAWRSTRGSADGRRSPPA